MRGTSVQIKPNGKVLVVLIEELYGERSINRPKFSCDFPVTQNKGSECVKGDKNVKAQNVNNRI